MLKIPVISVLSFWTNSNQATPRYMYTVYNSSMATAGFQRLAAFKLSMPGPETHPCPCFIAHQSVWGLQSFISLTGICVIHTVL